MDIKKIIDLELLRYYHGKSLAEIRQLIDNNAEVFVSNIEPSSEGAKVWFNTSVEGTTVNVPEINDSRTSVSDTWSSEKISATIDTSINEAITDNLVTKEDIDAMFKEAGL